MNKKGFTVIELIVSFALVMIVVVMLVQVVTIVKTLYVNAGIKTELLNKQAIMNRKISQQFNNKDIKAAVRCGAGCLTFIYEDDTSSNLLVNKETGMFSFIDNDNGTINYTTKLITGSHFGDIDISNETVVGVSDGKDNSFIKIKIPVKHTLVEGDFGINIIYQYDSRITAISDIVFDDQNTNEGGTIVLKGSSDMTRNKNLPFTDPGYYVIDSSGGICTPTNENNCGVTVSGTVGDEVNKTYPLTYTLTKDGKEMDQKVRRVLVLDDSFVYDYTGDVQEFTAPQSGSYKIELWGAGGGYGLANGVKKNAPGKGAYTSGEIDLTQGDKLYVYVGQKGADATVNSGGAKSYNGGGAGGTDPDDDDGGAGGGATDVRLVSGPWNGGESLRSRIMVAAGGNGSSFTYAGVSGGTINGLNHTVVSGNNGKGATQTGYFFGYSPDGGHCDNPGEVGPDGSVLSHGEPAAGGGYYGTYLGVCVNLSLYGDPGSASSFISGYTGCNAVKQDGTPSGSPNHYSGKVFRNGQMIAGNSGMLNPRGSGTITGNSGNGYARITLVSVSS